VLLLEGGYDLAAVEHGSAEVVRASARTPDGRTIQSPRTPPDV
jgi:hypothetical protein